jgi:hypothetical protein
MHNLFNASFNMIECELVEEIKKSIIKTVQHLPTAGAQQEKRMQGRTNFTERGFSIKWELRFSETDWELVPPSSCVLAPLVL